MSTSLTFILDHEVRHVSSRVARQDGDFDHMTLRDVDEILARSAGRPTPCRHCYVVPAAGAAVRGDGLAHHRQCRTWRCVQSSRTPRSGRQAGVQAAATRWRQQGEVEQAETDRLTGLGLYPPRTVNSTAAGRFCDEVSNESRSWK